MERNKGQSRDKLEQPAEFVEGLEAKALSSKGLDGPKNDLVPPAEVRHAAVSAVVAGLVVAEAPVQRFALALPAEVMREWVYGQEVQVLDSTTTDAPPPPP